MLRKVGLYKDTLRAVRGHSEEKVAAIQGVQQARWSQDKGEKYAMHDPMADVVGDSDIPAVTFNHAANVALIHGLLQMANAPAVIRPSFIGICFAFLLLRGVGGSVTSPTVNDLRNLMQDHPALSDAAMHDNAHVDYQSNFHLTPSAPPNGVVVGSAEWLQVHDDAVDAKLREFTAMKQHANAVQLLKEHRLKLQQQGKQIGDDYAMRLMAHAWFLQQEHSYATILNSSSALDAAQPIFLPPRDHVWPMDVLQTFNAFSKEEVRIIEYAASCASEACGSELINDIDVMIAERDQNDLHNNRAILTLHKVAFQLWSGRIFEINKPIMLQDFLRAKKNAQCIVGLTDGLAKYSKYMPEICSKLNIIQEHILRFVRDNIWADVSRYEDKVSIAVPIEKLDDAVLREVRIDTTIRELKQIFAQYWQKQATESTAFNVRVGYGIATIVGVWFSIVGWRCSGLLLHKIRDLWRNWQHWLVCRKNFQRYANMLSCAVNKHLAEIKSTAVVAGISAQELIGKIVAGILKQQKLSKINVAVRELAAGVVVSLHTSGYASDLRDLLSNKKQAAVDVFIVQYLSNLRDKISESKKKADVQSAVSICKCLPSDCSDAASPSDVTDGVMAQMANVASSRAQEAFVQEVEEVCLLVKKLHASIAEVLELTSVIRATRDDHALVLNAEDAALMDLIEDASRNCAVLFATYINDKNAQIFKIDPKKLTSQQLRKAMQDAFIEVADVAVSLTRYDMTIHAANTRRNNAAVNIQSTELAHMFRVRPKYLEFTNVKQQIQKICATLESIVEARAKQERKARLLQAKQQQNAMAAQTKQALPACAAVSTTSRKLSPYAQEIHICFIAAGDCLQRLQRSQCSCDNKLLGNISYIGELNALRFYMLRMVELTLQYAPNLALPAKSAHKLWRVRTMIAHDSYSASVEEFAQLYQGLNVYDDFVITHPVLVNLNQFARGVSSLRLWQRQDVPLVTLLRDALHNTLGNITVLVDAYSNSDKLPVAMGGVIKNYLFYSVYVIGAILHELDVIKINADRTYREEVVREAHLLLQSVYGVDDKFCQACKILRNCSAHLHELHDRNKVITYDVVDDIFSVMRDDPQSKYYYSVLRSYFDDLSQMRLMAERLAAVVHPVAQQIAIQSPPQLAPQPVSCASFYL